VNSRLALGGLVTQGRESALFLDGFSRSMRSFSVPRLRSDTAAGPSRPVKNSSTNETFGGDSCCEIEHLFYGQEATADYYQDEPCVGGSKIVFKSDADKDTFAKKVVPNLDPSCFEVFREIFIFIKSKC
jgi:hypothetical protein